MNILSKGILISVLSVWMVILSMPAFASNNSFHRMLWPEENADIQTIKITKDRTSVLRFDREIVRAATSNEKICNITNAGKTDIIVNAVEAGIINLIVWDKDNHVATYSLESELDLQKYYAMLKQIDPNGEFKIVPFKQSFAVYGTTGTREMLKKITEACAGFLTESASNSSTTVQGSSGGEKKAVALCFVTVRSAKQIMLEVQFAEVDRDRNKNFRFDFTGLTRFWGFGSYTGATGNSALESDTSYTPRGSVATFEALPPSLGNETAANLVFPYYSASIYLANYFKWLEEQNIIKILARPNLLAMDGEQAKFQVGGEFPIPITSGSSGTTTIEYKEYGNLLTFTPEVLDSGLIRLKVEAELSELDSTTSVTSGGVSVPGLLKRKETTVCELNDGETFVIAGIITQKLTSNNGKIPYLGDVPVLGKPFTRSYVERSDVELVVVITPRIVEPFKMESVKKYYDPKEVKEAVRIYAPPYPDAMGAAMDRLLAGNENYRDQELEKAELKRSAKEASRPKPTPAPSRTVKTNVTPSTVAVSAPVISPAVTPTANKWKWPSWPSKSSSVQAVYDEAPQSGPTLTNFTSKVS